MRQKILDLANGKLHFEHPDIEFFPDRLELALSPEETYVDSFEMVSRNHIPMSGNVSSSDSRMKCLTTEFSEKAVKIEFIFHTHGLAEGEQQEGDFFIMVNGGEYRLPFVITISKQFPKSSMGVIKNLFDFTNLARFSPEEALDVFGSTFFENILKPGEVKERLLYRAFGSKDPSFECMEAFLIGIKKKQEVRFSILEQGEDFFTIKQENWGYGKIEIRSDADFVVLEESSLSTEDFSEGQVKIGFQIVEDRLHAGNNYAGITLESGDQKERWEVSRQKTDTDGSDLFRKALQMELMQFYLNYRLDRLGKGRWAKESRQNLEEMRKMEPENLWYPLFTAYYYFMSRQRQDGGQLLEEFHRRYKEDGSPLWGFYLYLTTLQESEPIFVEKQMKGVREIFRKNREDLLLFLIILTADKELRENKNRKYLFLEQQYKRGCSSPVLYLETWELISADVNLLKKPGTFERSVLFFAVKRGLLTAEVSQQVQNISSGIQGYHPQWFQILKACYERTPQNSILKSICSYGIVCQRYNADFFPWYHKGIQEELSIVGLYEGWIYSASEEDFDPIPKGVAVYFGYQVPLEDRLRARLYVGILKNKDYQKGRYSAYSEAIRQFAMEQLLVGKIDESLAYLYEYMFQEVGLTDEMAESLPSVLYTNKLVCTDKNAEKVVVIYHQLMEEQTFLLKNQIAYLPLYGKDYILILEDKNGRRKARTDLYSLQPLMEQGRFTAECMKRGGKTLPLLLHYFDGKKTRHSFMAQDMDKLQYLIRSSEVSDTYRKEIQPQIIEYYLDAKDGEHLEPFLKQMSLSGLDYRDREQLMELMIHKDVYDRAYEMVLKFGYEHLDISVLLTLMNREIDGVQEEEEANLVSLCRYIFLKGKYNEKLLRYLKSHLKGPEGEIEKLWIAAKTFEMDTYELEGDFLEQLLYTESSNLELMEKVLRNYEAERGNDTLLMACLTYASYRYFVKKENIPKAFFLHIGVRMNNLKEEGNEICRLAYLKWISLRKGISPLEQLWQERIVEECWKKGYTFSFFQKLPAKLRQRYGWQDLTFLEYHGNLGNQVLLSYPSHENLPMESIYEGICIKGFVLFDKEELPYEINEVTPFGEVVEESGVLRHEKLKGFEMGKSRYDLLNAMGENGAYYGLYHDLEKKTKTKFSML